MSLLKVQIPLNLTSSLNIFGLKIAFIEVMFWKKEKKMKNNKVIIGRKVFGYQLVWLLILGSITACEIKGFKAASLEELEFSTTQLGPQGEKQPMSEESQKIIKEIQEELQLRQDELTLKNKAISGMQVELTQLKNDFACIKDSAKALQENIDCSAFEGYNRNEEKETEVDQEILGEVAERIKETQERLNEEITQRSEEALVFAEKLNRLISALNSYASSEDVQNLKDQLDEQADFLDQQIDTIVLSIVSLENQKSELKKELEKELESFQNSPLGERENQRKIDALKNQILELQSKIENSNLVQKELEKIHLSIYCMKPQIQETDSRCQALKDKENTEVNPDDATFYRENNNDDNINSFNNPFSFNTGRSEEVNPDDAETTEEEIPADDETTEEEIPADDDAEATEEEIPADDDAEATEEEIPADDDAEATEEEIPADDDPVDENSGNPFERTRNNNERGSQSDLF